MVIVGECPSGLRSPAEEPIGGAVGEIEELDMPLRRLAGQPEGLPVGVDHRRQLVLKQAQDCKGIGNMLIGSFGFSAKDLGDRRLVQPFGDALVDALVIPLGEPSIAAPAGHSATNARVAPRGEEAHAAYHPFPSTSESPNRQQITVRESDAIMRSAP